MSSVSIRFPDGSREFRFPHTRIREGDEVIHDGLRYRVISVIGDGNGCDVATVELVPEGLTDRLASEEGSVHFLPLDERVASGDIS